MSTGTRPGSSPTSGKPVLLLDEAVYGLDVYLRDAGWATEKVKPGTEDTQVVSIARKNGFIVITEDKQLASRCRVQGVKCVEIGFETMAPLVLDQLDRITGDGRMTS